MQYEANWEPETSMEMAGNKKARNLNLKGLSFKNDKQNAYFYGCMLNVFLQLLLVPKGKIEIDKGLWLF